MRVVLFLAADCANITNDGKLNVMGVFNDIGSTQFPARHPSMYLVVKLAADLGERNDPRDFAVRLLDADAHALLELGGQLQFPARAPGRTPEVNLLLALRDVVFPQEGTYVFVFLVDKEQRGELHLHLNKLEAGTPAKE